MQAVHRFEPTLRHLSVPAIGETALTEIGKAIAGTDDLVAIFMTKQGPPKLRGRICRLVQVRPMPTGQSIADFADYRKPQRWPIGWPCRVVAAPQPADCPRLRDVVAEVGEESFESLMGRLRCGPHRLTPRMGEVLAKYFPETSPINHSA